MKKILQRLPINKPTLLATASVLTLLQAYPTLAEDTVTPTSAAQQMQQFQFNIAAKPLPQAMTDFSVVTGIQVLYTETAAFDYKAPALKGQLTVQQALDTLLANTNLVARFTADNAVTIEKSAKVNADGSLQLGMVRVQGHAVTLNNPALYAGGQVATGARLGVLGNVDIMDTPFNVTAYTAELIEDQQSSSVADVLKNDPSVRFTTSDGHNSENFTIRGFTLNSSELALNGTYGLLPDGHVPTQFLERVEVLKGPSAMLSGIAPSGSVGGVINLVPKRAGEEDLTRLTASYETDSQIGTSVDIGRRFGEDKRFGVRFNGLITDGDTFVDDQEKEERFFSLGMDYQGDDWRLEFDAYRSQQNQDNGSPLMVGFTEASGVLRAADANDNALKGTFLDQETEGVLLRGEYDINDDWTVWSALGGSRFDYKGYMYGTRIRVTDASGTATGQTYNLNGFRHSNTAEAGLRGFFTTGMIDHHVIASANVLKTRSGSNVERSATYTTNLYDAVDPTLADYAANPDKTADNTFTSFSLSDTLNMFDDRLIVSLGSRIQRVRQSMSSPAYDEDAVTPLLGIVVKPWSKEVSLYANYVEGLSPGTTVTDASYDNYGKTLSPYKTKQSEVGVKWEYNHITNTFALFHITKPDLIVVNNEQTLGEDQVHNGVEWNIFGQLTSDVRVLGGAAYTRAKYDSKDDATDGNRAPGVPKWTANIGAEWDTPWDPSLTLTSRVTYTSSQYLDEANELEIPSWTVMDIGARYTTEVGGKDVVLRASIDNLFDRDYWSGRFGDGYATLGAPRTVKLSASVDF